MQKALSLFEKGPLALVAGRDLNPRPLGYEPYDVCLWRPEQSLAGVVTSADRPGPSRSVGPVSPASYCLVASGLQTGLQNKLLICSFPHPPHPSAPFRGCRPWARGTVSGLDKRLPGGAASTRDVSPPVVPDARPRGAPVVITAAGSAPGHRPHRCLSSPPEPGCCRTLRQTGSVQGRRSRSRSKAAKLRDLWSCQGRSPDGVG
jgi:hypothetical protein